MLFKTETVALIAIVLIAFAAVFQLWQERKLLIHIEQNQRQILKILEG
jgi:cell division protein FtsL